MGTDQGEALSVRPGSRLLFALIAAVASACASPSRGPVVSPEARRLVATSDAEVLRGCLKCLEAAAAGYDRASGLGVPGDALKAATAWTLVAARQRELGISDDAALTRASSLGGPSFDSTLFVATRLPLRSEGVSKERTTPRSRELLEAMEGRGASPELDALNAKAAEGDLAARYVLLSARCAWGRSENVAKPEGLESGGSLLAFRWATCPPRPDADAMSAELDSLLAVEPRFHEVHFFRGRAALVMRRALTAEREFFQAADALPQMAAAWAMLGATRLALEEYVEAAEDMERVLAIEPAQREALLIQARAFASLGRYEEAAASARKLVDMGQWYVSDANYWLAFAETHLGRLQEADVHVREARRTNPMHGDTARLSGLVAFRRDELPRAREEFGLALSRNAEDCESVYHLALLDQREQAWSASRARFTSALECYGREVAALEQARRGIEAGDDPQIRADVSLARNSRRLAGAKRSVAASALGLAEAATQTGDFDAALARATDAAAHPDFVARVADLRRRVEALRAREPVRF